jgi:hypothetical protein
MTILIIRRMKGEFAMTTGTAVNKTMQGQLPASDWRLLGLLAVIGSIVAVITVQTLAISIWPQIALFAPLDSYVRSALFTLVPAVGATLVFAWLAGRSEHPVRDFLILSAVLLLLSLIPDYLLPVPHKTILASSIAALLHVIAAVVIVSILLTGYRRRTAPQ